MDRHADSADGGQHTDEWLIGAAQRLTAEHPDVPGYVVADQLRQVARAVEQLGDDVRLRELAVTAAETNIRRISGALVSGGGYPARAPAGGPA